MSGENHHMQNHMHRSFKQLISDGCQLSPVAASATICCAALSHVFKIVSSFNHAPLFVNILHTHAALKYLFIHSEVS